MVYFKLHCAVFDLQSPHNIEHGDFFAYEAFLSQEFVVHMSYAVELTIM